MLPPLEQRIDALPDALCEPLLLLAFADSWHPVSSLTSSPELPEDWWFLVNATLPLSVLPGGGAKPSAELLDALQQRLATASPRTFKRLASEQARRMRISGDIGQSVALYHAAGERKTAERVLEEHQHQLMSKREYQTVLDLTAAMKPDWLTPRSRALRLKAMLALSCGEERQALGREAEAMLAAGDHNPTLVSVVADVRHRAGHDPLALHLLTETLSTRLTLRDRLELLDLKVNLLGYQGEYDAQIASAREMVGVAQRLGDLASVAKAHVAVAYAWSDQGKLTEADPHFTRAVKLLKATSDWPALIVLLNNYAQSLTAAGRPGEAKARLTEAAALPGRTKRHEMWLAVSEAILHHQYNMHRAALTSSALAVEAANREQMDGQLMTALCMRAERLAMDGQAKAASEASRQTERLLTDHPYREVQYRFSKGIVAYAAGDYRAATEHFAQCDMEQMIGWDRPRLQLYRMALERRQGTEPDTQPLLHLFELIGTSYPLVTDTLLLGDTLAWLRTQPGWAPRLDALFAEKSAGTVQLHLELYGPLEVYTDQGRLHIPLARSAELLAYLVLHGSASRQELLNALFDGSTDQRAVEHLKKLIRTLREALRPLLPDGAEPVPSEHRRFSLNPLLQPTVGWLPAGVFPAPGVRLGGPVQVRGPFLADVRGEWAADVRQQVHETLREHLQQAVAAGDLTAHQELRVAEGME
ncbi:hypothetical protein D3875_07335 [Deinococcus cavernae]|uniref:Uncharacterized protein n=1 Tax=Deinococcus cavernae TaxID=2320857 RepID=A0A418V5M4_9DEIO|nr:tetratricopeptide repeat protein [Deinococcus cavernae]RJF71411.1 hypothetical protein D3875_07335 [Deinococcus cavernae]